MVLLMLYFYYYRSYNETSLYGPYFDDSECLNALRESYRERLDPEYDAETLEALNTLTVAEIALDYSLGGGSHDTGIIKLEPPHLTPIPYLIKELWTRADLTSHEQMVLLDELGRTPCIQPTD